MELRFHNEVTIPVRNTILKGELAIPSKASAIVIFAHGSGSSRLSPRNRIVAKKLHERYFGTLLFDLLTPSEDNRYEMRFDIELLTKRLAGATEWLEKHPAAKDCRIGYFGASTGAAAALKAASYLSSVSAIVSRGGRPDLAMENLANVEAPTLLIVGSLDYDVLRLNKEAYIQLDCKKKLEVVEGATHLFEESGTMEKVTELAVNWFEKYLLQPATSSYKDY
ncbi:MAG: dienelactone hydrolase family protein [Bacteroidetes bacterium]|nr:dienelactone hydrolase family protein [Bacteroidota bacterium]